jgi:hypothetical protein
MAQPNPKLYQTDQIHFVLIKVTRASTGISSGVRAATLPAGAIIHGTDVNVTEVFNAGTTNVLVVGINSSSYNNMIASGDVDETALGLTQNVKPTGTALVPLAADSDVYVKFTETGTASTTGIAYILIKYVPGTNLISL